MNVRLREFEEDGALKVVFDVTGSCGHEVPAAVIVWEPMSDNPGIATRVVVGFRLLQVCLEKLQQWRAMRELVRLPEVVEQLHRDGLLEAAGVDASGVVFELTSEGRALVERAVTRLLRERLT